MACGRRSCDERLATLCIQFMIRLLPWGRCIMTYLRKNLSFRRFAVAAAVLLLCIPGLGVVRGQDGKDRKENIKEIQKARLANAMELHEFAVKHYPRQEKPTIVINIEQVVQAKSLLLELQLQHASTKADRLKVYENALKAALDFEDRVQMLAQATALYMYDGLRYRAYRLELEEALAREKKKK